MISIWERETYYRDADVCIAGGGFMGMWTAYELLQRSPGLRITIVEAAPVAALASTRNAGFACFGSPSELWSDRQTMGEDAMWQVVEMRYKGIRKLRRTWGDKAIGYEPSGGYELFKDNQEWEGQKLEEKMALLNAGLACITGEKHTYTNDTEQINRLGMQGFSAMAGNRLEGGLHSGRLAVVMADWLRQSGVVILTGHRVEAVTVLADGQHIQLAAAGRIIECKARSLVWATNGALDAVPGLGKMVVPARGQVILSPPIDGLALTGTFHVDEGFYYFRNLGNRLLLGGARNMSFESEQSHLPETTAEIMGHLKGFIRAHLPQAAAFLDAPGWMQWAGIMGMSAHKLPIVMQTSPGVWAALACNGMGVALTPMVAEQVADAVIAGIG